MQRLMDTYLLKLIQAGLLPEDDEIVEQRVYSYICTLLPGIYSRVDLVYNSRNLLEAL